VSPAFFYALTTVIHVPFEASFKAGLVVFGLYAGVVFTFLLFYNFQISWFYRISLNCITFRIYLSHPGKAGELK